MERLVYAVELLPIFGFPIILKLQTAEEEHEQEALNKGLDKISARYRMKICAEKPN